MPVTIALPLDLPEVRVLARRVQDYHYLKSVRLSMGLLTILF